MDKKVKEYNEIGRQLRELYTAIKRGKVIRKNNLLEQYEPIIQPLQTISKKIEGIHPQQYVASLLEDKHFGLRFEGDKNLYIGNKPVMLKGTDIIIGDDAHFKYTPGLRELLTANKPSNFTAEDLSNYEYIVLDTNTYRQNNNPNEKRIKSYAGQKYKKIIRPILVKNNIISDATEKKVGSGLKKVFTSAPVEYVYWNSLDELLERLYILYGELKSGNNNPVLVNEIINIVQEFKEL